PRRRVQSERTSSARGPEADVEFLAHCPRQIRDVAHHARGAKAVDGARRLRVVTPAARVRIAELSRTSKSSRLAESTKSPTSRSPRGWWRIWDARYSLYRAFGAHQEGALAQKPR